MSDNKHTASVTVAYIDGGGDLEGGGNAVDDGKLSPDAQQNSQTAKYAALKASVLAKVPLVYARIAELQGAMKDSSYKSGEQTQACLHEMEVMRLAQEAALEGILDPSLKIAAMLAAQALANSQMEVLHTLEEKNRSEHAAQMIKMDMLQAVSIGLTDALRKILEQEENETGVVESELPAEPSFSA